jgi:NAD(P)-dependent dehydrogenase (short-subunit alcohol dehydrogenase family)
VNHAGDLVLVTSVASPLGYSIAQYLAQRGFLVFGGVPPGRTESVRSPNASPPVELIDFDSQDSQSVASVVETLSRGAHGPPYGLINTATTASRVAFDEMTDAELRQVIDVNVFATMAVTRAVLPVMRAAGRGRVVSLGSAVGRGGAPGLAAYGLTMQALVGWHEALALELMPFGLTASVVEAGPVPAEARAVTPAVAQAVYRALIDRRPRFRYPFTEPSPRLGLLRRPKLASADAKARG